MKALARFLYYLYKPTGYLFIAPLLVAGLVALASNVLPRLIGAGKRRRELEAAGKTFQTPQELKDAANEARGLANMGDPNFNVNKQQIDRQQANAVAAAKATGNVSDILGTVTKSQQTATDASLRNSAMDSQYRFNAKKYLNQILLSLGGAEFGTQRANYGAVQTEFGRQQANIQGWAQAGNNLAGDVSSYGLMKEFGSGYGGGFMPSYPRSGYPKAAE